LEAEVKDNLYAFGCKYYKGYDKPIGCKYNHLNTDKPIYRKAKEMLEKKRFFIQERKLRKKKFEEFKKKEEQGKL
jgi:hypothetical protein